MSVEGSLLERKCAGVHRKILFRKMILNGDIESLVVIEASKILAKQQQVRTPEP